MILSHFNSHNKITFSRNFIISLNVIKPSTSIRNFTVLDTQCSPSLKSLVSKTLLPTFSKRFTGGKKAVETIAKTLPKTTEITPTVANTFAKPIFNPNLNRFPIPRFRSLMTGNFHPRIPTRLTLPSPSSILSTRNHVKPLSQEIISTAKTYPILNNIKDKLPPSELELKTNSGKTFTTTLNETSVVDDFSDDALIDELKKRELIKTDEGNTAVIVKLQDGTDFFLGKTKHGIKLSPLGQAYSKIVTEKKVLQEQDSQDIPKSDDNDSYEFIISVPPKASSELFIETGEQKHLLVVHNKNNDEYFAIGYLTSKKTGHYMHDEQIKIFVNKKNDPNFIPKTNKAQHFKDFDQAKIIEPQDINRVMYDTEYFKSLPEKSQDIIKAKYDELMEKKYIEFNKQGLSKQDCLNMCKEHDKIVQSKEKHPLTNDQHKQNENNKIKQQETNKLPKSNED